MKDAIQAKDLFNKLNTGNISPSERALLELWYINWGTDDTLGLSDQEFEELSNALDKRIPYLLDNKHTVPIWPKVVAAAAAVLLIGILVGVFNNLSNRKSKELTVMYASRIAPGNFGGTLTLSNGQKIALKQIKNQEITTDGNASIQIRSGGLKYQEKAGLEDFKKSTNILETTYGQQCRVELPDGTIVWLNATSSLSYPTSFRGDSMRKVNLTGEAYFEVSKDKFHPFVVSASNQTVEVLGTHFNISAYQNDSQTITTLAEGSVQVNKHILKPNQEAVQRNGTITVHEVNAQNAISWKNGVFTFSDEPLENVMKKIARWYNVKIVFEDSADKSYLYGGAISRYENITKVLDQLSEAGSMHYKIIDTTVYISK